MELYQNVNAAKLKLRQAIVQATVQESFEPESGFDPQEGQLVKLKTDGTIAPLAAATDIPLGVVHRRTSATRDHDTKATVGVKTYFGAIAYMAATGATNRGVEVAFASNLTVGTEKYTKFAAASTGNVVIGITLEAAAGADSIVKVGLFNGFYKK
jgi:hypothetical protein